MLSRKDLCFQVNPSNQAFGMQKGHTMDVPGRRRRRSRDHTAGPHQESMEPEHVGPWRSLAA
ncbi:hypothetical protein PAHAL_9G393300 [Panicum hallii]|uniref:Uncharacterized protein n=1 Tax=Panicum hallii TaxID=206008 RepID=A0A2T8I409_9POAL|nr:hypothetical protein PAHAL_9G393300 [Panicum hallii]